MPSNVPTDSDKTVNALKALYPETDTILLYDSVSQSPVNCRTREKYEFTPTDEGYMRNTLPDNLLLKISSAAATRDNNSSGIVLYHAAQKNVQGSAIISVENGLPKILNAITNNTTVRPDDPAGVLPRGKMLAFVGAPADAGAFFLISFSLKPSLSLTLSCGERAPTLLTVLSLPSHRTLDAIAMTCQQLRYLDRRHKQPATTENAEIARFPLPDEWITVKAVPGYLAINRILYAHNPNLHVVAFRNTSDASRHTPCPRETCLTANYLITQYSFGVMGVEKRNLDMGDVVFETGSAVTRGSGVEMKTTRKMKTATKTKTEMAKTKSGEGLTMGAKRAIWMELEKSDLVQRYLIGETIQACPGNHEARRGPEKPTNGIMVAVLLSSHDISSKTEYVNKMINDGEVQYIVQCQMLGEGADIPVKVVTFLARRSLSIVYQLMGGGGGRAYHVNKTCESQWSLRDANIADNIVAKEFDMMKDFAKLDTSLLDTTRIKTVSPEGKSNVKRKEPTTQKEFTVIFGNEEQAPPTYRMIDGTMVEEEDTGTPHAGIREDADIVGNLVVEANRKRFLEIDG
ncbi:hypothetical protein DFJ77DRAFT_544592 [Powellomyces hirtus]|nr:hypothetical protein DFJ77DRAFT_544592 [Powellomyces hirtus]